MLIIHWVTQRIRKGHGGFPIGLTTERLHDPSNRRNAAFCIGKGAVFFQEGCPWEKDVGIFCGLVQKDILDDQTVKISQRRFHVMRIRIRLRNILALTVEPFIGTRNGPIEHVRDPQAGLRSDADPPTRLEHLTHPVIRYMTITWQLVRKGAHITSPLNIILTSKRVNTDPLST